MKELKCVKCKSKFEMPDDFYGGILCEGCDPKMQKPTKAWLVRDKVGKMKRSIWFNREHATMFQKDYNEVVRVILSIEVLRKKG
mgnify:FL=1